MKRVATNQGYDLKAKINPKEVSAELKKLGTFNAEDIVRVAQSPTSPLHKYFEWDDRKAAHSFRLQQARHLVVAISFEDADGDLVREYESVVIDDKRMYVPMTTIRKDESLFDQVIEQALREVIYWKTKHQRYQKFFGGIFGEITKAEEAYRRKTNGKENKGSRKRSRKRNENNDTANKKNDGDRYNSWRKSAAG